jgi:general secretion pathway protein G
MSQPTQHGAKKKKWPWWVRAAGWFIGIILVLTLVSYPSINWYAGKHPGGKDGFQKETEAKIKIKSLEFLLYVSKRSNGRYPTDAEGLGAAFSKKEKDKDEIGESDEVRETLLDPWKRRYRYRSPGLHNKKTYDLYSLGPDGIEDTEDDIKNW